MTVSAAFWRRALLAAYVVVLVGAGLYLNAMLPHTAYRDDETGWVRNCIHIAQVVLAGDFRPASWEFEEDTYYGSLNPHLGKFPFTLVAIALRPHFGGQLPEAPKPYHFTRVPGDYELQRNIREGRVAPPDVLIPMRRVSMLWGVLLIAACMITVHIAVSPAAGLLTGMLLLLNEPLTRTSTQVMTDAPYNFFTALAALAGMAAVASATGSQAKWRYFLLAMTVACATATKLAGWILLFPIAVITCVVLWKRGLIGPRWALALVPGMMVIVGALNFALNPYLWPDLSGVSVAKLRAEWRLLKYGEFEVAGEQGAPAWLARYQSKPAQPGLNKLTPEALRQLRQGLWEKSIGAQRFSVPAEHPIRVIPAWYELTRPVQFPLLYVRWNTLKKFIWETKRRSSPDVFVRNVCFLGQSIPGEIGFAALGLGVVLWRTLRASDERIRAKRFMFLVYVASITFIIFLTRLNDSDRYVLPILIIRAMLASVGIVVLAQLLFGGLARRWLPGREAAPVAQ